MKGGGIVVGSVSTAHMEGWADVVWVFRCGGQGGAGVVELGFPEVFDDGCDE